VGSLPDLAPWLKDNEYAINDQFKDSVLLPGMIDPHLHPLLGAVAFQTVWITPEPWNVMGQKTPATNGQEAPPFWNGGVMFGSTPGNQVIAIDAKRGTLLWRYRRPIPEDAVVMHPTSRGVALHGDKVFLGRTGNFDGVDVLKIIFEQPVTAEYLAGKIYRFLVREDLSPELRKKLGAILRQHNHDVKPLLPSTLPSEANEALPDPAMVTSAFSADRPAMSASPEPATVVWSASAGSACTWARREGSADSAKTGRPASTTRCTKPGPMP